MPACSGHLGLCVLDRSDSQAERNSKSPEAILELEAGDLEQLGRLPEIDPLIEVVADHLDLREILRLFGACAGGANGEGSQETVVESIQEDDPFLPSADNDRKLTILDPIQDLAGPLGQLGWGEDGLRHRNPHHKSTRSERVRQEGRLPLRG